MSFLKQLLYQNASFQKCRPAKVMAGNYVQNMEEIVPVMGTSKRYDYQIYNYVLHYHGFMYSIF